MLAALQIYFIFSIIIGSPKLKNSSNMIEDQKTYENGNVSVLLKYNPVQSC